MLNEFTVEAYHSPIRVLGTITFFVGSSVILLSPIADNYSYYLSFMHEELYYLKVIVCAIMIGFSLINVPVFLRAMHRLPAFSYSADEFKEWGPIGSTVLSGALRVKDIKTNSFVVSDGKTELKVRLSDIKNKDVILDNIKLISGVKSA